MNHVEFLEIGVDVDFSKLDELTEVKLRNSLGRIYYYTYHEALSFVSNDIELNKLYLNLKQTIQPTHKLLISTFAEKAKETQNKNYGKISRLLGVMHKLRCNADYDMDIIVGKNEFLSMLAQLDDLKSAANELNPDRFTSLVTPEKTSIIETKIDNASIKVFKKDADVIPKKKKPSLRLLD